ncbi:hypothetical protein QYE76_001772 [Lolium multiflorum]|uniref:CCHC-type domain-containing protein n=1 Tax=Lolium multiflorum TaxID=4521 RepID=A0AAD8RMR1_LOLMU|nr:hypothetical protein QYE76_001772 [Lolium multiflorum]
MENYSLLMGDISVDEDGGGVDGDAFRGHFPSVACVGTETLSPGSWLRDGGGSGRRIKHQVLMVNKTTSFKKQGKSKGKFKKGGKKAATPPVKPKNGPKPDAECYYCKEKGHWKHNCSKYLADLKSGLVKKKKEGTKE